MENYCRYKMMGGSIFIKVDVVPHKFRCQPDRNEPTATTTTTEQSLSVDEERAELYKHEIFGVLVPCLDFSSTSTAKTETAEEDSQSHDCH